MPYLKLVAGSDQRSYEIREPVAVLGRDPGAAVVFSGDDARVVSARHAEARLKGDTWHLKDLESRNGTWVNGARLAGEVTLREGDEIRLGEAGPRLRVGALREPLAETLAETPGMPAPPPRPAEVRAYAVTLLDAKSGQRFEARGLRIRMGRGKECEVRPVESTDETVSRVHAELTAGPTGALVVRDPGSKNGTLLNGKPIAQPTPIRLGDRIKLGPQGPELIVEGLGTSPGIPAAVRAGGVGPDTVMGLIGAALAKARAAPTGKRRTTAFVEAIAEEVRQDARRKIRWLTTAVMVLLVLFGGGAYAAYRFLWVEAAANTERAVRSVEDSARAETERLRRELAEARAAAAPAAQVDLLRAQLESAQAYTEDLRQSLQRAQADMQTQLTTAETRRQQAAADLQRLREQLAEAERRGPGAEVLDSLRRAVSAAESQTAQLTAKLRAVRSADFATIAQETQGAVGLVTVLLGADRFDATGFVISADGYLLTNWHAVADSAHPAPDSIWVTMADESRPRLADLVGVSRERDLALVHVREYQGPWIRSIDWAGTRARQGEPAALIGFPAGAGFARDRSAVMRTSMTAGILSRVTPELVQFDGMTTGGSSGSPVLNADGAVVSVHRAGLRQGQGFSLTVPVRYALTLLPPDLRTSLGTPDAP